MKSNGLTNLRNTKQVVVFLQSKYILLIILEPMSMFAKDNCIFCQMVEKKKEVEVVAQFKHSFVIKDQYPVSPGHLLIISYLHTENWFTSDNKVKEEIVHVLDKMKQLIDDEYHPNGYNIGMNCGKPAGQTVMHLHVHLIPRFEGDMDNPKGGVRGVIPSKQKY